MGRKRHTIEDDDTSGVTRFLIERNFGVDARKSVLFAHEPCIEDVSQGAMGDCYFLTGLVSVLQKDPGKIREMMMDNGDGSVTVRFFDQRNKMKPVYITVDKMVRLTGANHTVWVQVMEKAFTAYLQYKEDNALKIRRGTRDEQPYEFDHDKIEYGFITKGGKTQEAVEALTGVMGVKKEVKVMPKLLARTKSLEDEKIYMGMLVKESYNHSWSEKTLRALREKELAYDQRMMSEAKKILKQLCANRDWLKNFTISDKPEERPEAYTDLEKHYFETIEDAIKRRAYVSAGTIGTNDQHFDTGGICNNHAYTVLDAFTDEKNGKKYVVVRDPHGGAGRD